MTEEVANQRKTIGNACLTLHRSTVRVHRRFLRRNLRHILDSHDKQLLLQKQPRPAHDAPHEDMIANEKRTWGWDFPTTVMLEEFMRGQRPILQLETLQIRHPTSKASIEKCAKTRFEGLREPDWLVDPRAQAEWPCAVGVCVSSANDKRVAHKNHVLAKIRQVDFEDGPPVFEVVLDRPFFVEIDKLFVVEESGNNGSRSWKRTVTASYRMEITIQCQDSDDSADFLSRLEDRPISSYQSTLGSEALLKATWEELPKCPPDNHLMVLKRAKGHSLLVLNYGLEAALGWIRRRESKLAIYNKVINQTAQTNEQLPTPSASDDLERAVKMYAIDWKFRENSITRYLTSKGLACPFCRDVRDFTNFDRLRLHCNRFHSHFVFETEKVVERPGSPTTRASIALRTAPPAPDEDIDDDDDFKDKINWVAPARPFDLSAHLRGTDDWAGPNGSKGSKKTARGKAPARDKDAAPAPVPTRKRPAPDEVEDLPASKRKKHRVPDVPDVTFYRTTSKQPIQPGEYIAESDDEVDESWLVQREGRALDDLGLEGGAKDFTQALNRHLALEQSHSSVLTRDALVRFIRTYREPLKEVSWQRHFRAKLKQLLQNGIIGDDIVEHCVSVLRSADVSSSAGNGTTSAVAADEGDASAGGRRGGIDLRNESATPDPSVNGVLPQRERKRWMSGKTAGRESPALNGDTAASKAAVTASSSKNDTLEGKANAKNVPPRPRARVCTCGESAKDTRGGIACADMKCVRQDYHLQCVALQRRVPDWRCKECERARPTVT